jgi:putative transcriptional regulator
VFAMAGMLSVSAGVGPLGVGSVPAAMAPDARPPRPAPARGMFLIADRKLVDANFSQSVVLLLEYDAKGALGLIVNRPTQIPLKDLLPDIEELQALTDTVYLGGPVSKDHVVLLMRSEQHPPGAGRVFADTYASSSMNTLRQAASEGRHSDTFRAYVGYAGWGPGQLDGEIARGDWYLSAADEATLFDAASETIWPRLIEKNAGQWVYQANGWLRVAGDHR